MRQIEFKIFLSIIIILNINMPAKSTAFLKIGSTFSTFTNVDNSKYKIGYSVGIEKDWRILHNFYIVSSVHYNTRGGILKNVTYGYGGDSNSVKEGDIHAYLYYVSLPLLIQYTREIKEGIFLNVFVGPSIDIASESASDIKNQEVIYDPLNDSRDDFVDPEYYSTIDVFSNYGCPMNVGIGIEFSYFVLDYFYSNGLSISSVAGVDLYKSTHSHVVRLGVIL